MKNRSSKLAVLLSLCLLVGAAAEGISIDAPPDAAPYHARVKAAGRSVPSSIGDWIGHDVPMPNDASALLRPNVAISRDFSNLVTGRKVSVFFVQCTDTRDLAPHYPPVCYPVSRGMVTAAARPRDWSVGGLKISGMEYDFRPPDFTPGEPVVVQNFILSPSGQIYRDMEPMKHPTPTRNRYYGGAQMQLVFDNSVPQEERDATLVEIASGYRQLIDAVLSQRQVSHE